MTLRYITTNHVNYDVAVKIKGLGSYLHWLSIEGECTTPGYEKIPFVIPRINRFSHTIYSSQYSTDIVICKYEYVLHYHVPQTYYTDFRAVRLSKACSHLESLTRLMSYSLYSRDEVRGIEII